MVLHIFSKGLNHQKLLQKCLDLFEKGDHILFIEDGIYWATNCSITGNYDFNIYSASALGEDILARGITNTNPLINRVSYEEFVDLTVTCEKSVSWF